MRGVGHIALALPMVAAVACGGQTLAPPTPTGPAAGLEAPRAAADDELVATVDGHPVWASCVTDQLHRGAATRDAALRECVDVELLARAADRRGLAIDPDVVLATRTAIVSKLVAVGFEDRIRTTADIPADIVDKAFEKNAFRMHRPEVRSSAYARVVVAADVAPGSAADTAAHALADRIAAAAAPETGLFAVNLGELADRLGAGTGLKVEHTDVPAMTPDALAKPYADALYALPAIGRTSAAVRTKWGWDVILWTDVLPPLETSRDELLAQMLPDLRRAYFATWCNDIARSLGVHLELEQASLPLLDQLPTTGSLP